MSFTLDFRLPLCLGHKVVVYRAGHTVLGLLWSQYALDCHPVNLATTFETRKDIHAPTIKNYILRCLSSNSLWLCSYAVPLL